MTQALEKSPAPRTSVITTPDQYRSSLQVWQQQAYHVLSPLTHVGAIPPQFGLVPAIVTINPDPAGGEVYRDPLFCDGDEVALAKPGLSKIALAAGMSIRTERTDPRTIPHYWEVRATARFVSIDGTVQELDATAEYDLRDSSPRVNRLQAAAKRKNRDASGQIESARQFGLRGCEARAINAVIRQYGVRQKYQRQDVAKPFVVCRVVFLPDLTDPEQRRLVTERALAGTSTLFGPRALPAAPPAPPAAEPIDTIGVGAPTATAGPAPDPGVRIEAIAHDIEAGLYELRLEGGEVVSTRSHEVAQAAAAAVKAGQRVRLEPDAAESDLIGGLVPVGAAAEPSQAAGALHPGATTIRDVKRASGKKGDRPWSRYDLTFADGRTASTFNEPLQKLVDDAYQQQAPVRIELEAADDPRYDDKLVSLVVIDTRQGTLPIEPSGGY